MTDALRSLLLDVLKVPAEPRLPGGDPESARVFRAGASYWRLRLAGWVVQQLVLAGMLAALFGLGAFAASGGRSRRAAPDASLLFYVVPAVAGGLWLVQLAFSYTVLRLDYDLRWYIVTDRAVRVREGILRLKEMTFSLANVQDVRLAQGPLQRLFGLADVELRTAGGSEVPAPGGHGGPGTENLHLARFRSVDDAEAVRDLLATRMKAARGAGLGDPDDVRPHVALAKAPPDDLTAAAQELAAESARLRDAVTRRAR